MSDNKHKCNCNNCDCCNGYARDVKNPNRYVNLENGKERNLNHKKPKLDWLIILLLLPWLWNYMYGQNPTTPSTNRGIQQVR